MSARARILLIFVSTLFILGVSLGFVAGRVRHWHERGWSGVSYLFGPSSAQQAKMQGLEPYQVLLTAQGSPAEGRLRFRDEVLALDGIPRDDIKRLQALDAKTKRGDVVVYRVRRGKQILDIPLRFESPLRSRTILIRNIVAIVVAITFVGIALLIVVRAPADPRAVVFHALATLSGIAILGAAATVFEQTNARGINVSPFPQLSMLLVLSAAAFMYPPLILHLALIFPRRRPILERNPILIRWIYAVALLALVTVGISVAAFAVMDWENLEASEARTKSLIRPMLYTLTGFGVLVALHLLYAARREGIRRAIINRPFRVALATIGLIFGLSRAAAMLIAPFAAGVVGGSAMLLPLIVLMTFPIFALVALVRSRTEGTAEEKRQVAWPLWGLLIAVGSKVLSIIVTVSLTAWITLTGADMMVWRDVFEVLNIVPTIITLAIPISFAVAILKYRLMNIDVIIRKTVVYAILSGAIIAVYLGLVGGLGSFLVYAFGLENQTTMIIGSTLVVALLVVPVRNRLQTFVDRTLFRHKYDYPEALKALAAESRTTTDASVLLESAAEKLQRALQSRAVVIFAERQDDLVAVAKVGVADSLVGRLSVPHSFAATIDRPFDPRRRTLPEDAAAAFGKIEAELIVPAGTRAFIAVAPKLSGGGYDVEDIDFLRSVGDQLDTGLERIRMQAEEQDFVQASAIQQRLLPREMPRVAKLDVSGVWKPARTMGGDYYDLIVLSETELAICIGDVAGKGMPAAILMSGLQAAVRASASSSPRDLCERVRRVVVSSLSGGRFVTFFYATLDTAAMRLRWCNAGHNAPVLARADGTMVRLAEGGPAISRLFRTPYEEREVAVGPGDRLVLFTDGVSEATDAAGEMFGETRIEELVSSSRRSLSAAELQQEIVDAAFSFSGGELEDDVTLVVARVTE
jgi:hypothetical protein